MKPSNSTCLLAAFAVAALFTHALPAAMPDAVPYQGRIAVDAVNFTGTGQFKFAIYEQTPGNDTTINLRWTNTAGETTGTTVTEPTTAVALDVAAGLYSTGLGDTALSNMAALPASLAPADGKRSFIRVWFNDGIHGFQPVSPDLELRSVPFAREAASVGGLSLANLARTDTPNTFTHVDGLTVTGPGPLAGNVPAAGATVPVQGAGSRLEYLPGYGAFRAGMVTGDQWDASSIGLYSVALGRDAKANGFNSTAFGYQTTASGNYASAFGMAGKASGGGSTAFGYSTNATGNYSTALGYTTTASGTASIATGNATLASGDYASAFGSHSSATGQGSTAFGSSTTAGNQNATAFGSSTTAGGQNSTAFGFNTEATGYASVAFGLDTTARSAAEIALGRYNTEYAPLSTADWVNADRLLVVGNGTADATRSDALIMLKSGDTTLNAHLRVSDVRGALVAGPGPSGTSPNANSTVPASGAGSRMQFLPGYGAFRAGAVGGSQWDIGNMGVYSCATGRDTIASGNNTTAIGYQTTASGDTSFAAGYRSTASGSTSSWRKNISSPSSGMPA